jgi:superfamily II DNA or RNA helicase
MWNFQVVEPLTQPSFTLRDYQGLAIAQTESHHANGKRRAFICAPTGSGKGTMIGAMAQRAICRGERVIIVVTMLPLIMQAVEDLEDFGLAGNISVICGSLPASWTDYSKPIQVCTLQSLAGRSQTVDYLSNADLIVFDEFHTSGFFEVADPILNEWRGNVAAFSATPYNRAMGDRADAAVLCPSYNSLQQQGFLVPLRYSIHQLPLGHNQKRDLNSDEGIEYILAQYLQSEGVRVEGAGRSLWFCEANRGKGQSQSLRLQRIAKRYGLNLIVINDELSNDAREQAINDCKLGLNDGLISVDALAVGVDIKCIRHVNIVRKVGSRDRFTQIVGRVTRIDPESGKVAGFINDFGGNVDPGDGSGLHPLIEILSEQITEENILRLPSEAGEGEAPQKPCSICGYPNHAAAIECRICSAPFPTKESVGLENGAIVNTEWSDFLMAIGVA